MRYKLNIDAIVDTKAPYLADEHVVKQLSALGILVPVEEKKCCDKCAGVLRDENNFGTNYGCLKDNCPCHKETLNPYDVRVEPTTDKEEWGEADFQALFAGYYSSQNKIREFIHRAEKEAVQKSRKDWLREEIERLEGMKDYDINNTNFDAGSNTLNEVHNEGYHFALQTIQDHYQKELNQK